MFAYLLKYKIKKERQRKLTWVWLQTAVVDSLLVCSNVADFCVCSPGPNMKRSICTAGDYILSLQKHRINTESSNEAVYCMRGN